MQKMGKFQILVLSPKYSGGGGLEKAENSGARREKARHKFVK